MSSEKQNGIDRRGFLKCMQWAGAAMAWDFSGGVVSSRLLGAERPRPVKRADFTFVQISDSHLGFNKPANTDVSATLHAAIGRIQAMEVQPDFVLHTGDVTHLARAAEFDAMDQIAKELGQKEVFYVPGEHDTTGDDGKLYLERFGKRAAGNGWYSFDHKGVHFVGLNNVALLEGIGSVGPDQMKWLTQDLQALSAETPVVVFAHIPLWTVYPEWGWATQDSEQVLSHLKRFGSVTVLNGHIHQVMQKVEGNVTFHSAMSTAFPQPAPGTAPAPGPMKVPAERLQQVLGITQVRSVAGQEHLAVVDRTLAES